MVIGLMLGSLSLNLLAESVKFINTDGTVESDVCIAAGTSKSVLQGKLDELSFSSEKLNKIKCNGLSVVDFGKKYNKARYGREADNLKVFSFINESGSRGTSLCIAAATSNKAWEKATGDIPRSLHRGLEKLKCNDIGISDFAKKYGNDSFKV